MAKTKALVVRISPEQEQILEARTRAAGFTQKSDYIRFSLFMPMPIEEKITKIYDNTCKNG